LTKLAGSGAFQSPGAWGADRRPPLLLPSQAELVLRLIGLGGDLYSAADVDNAPYLTALVQSSLIVIPSGTRRKQQPQCPNFECRTGLASRCQTARWPCSISLEDERISTWLSRGGHERDRAQRAAAQWPFVHPRRSLPNEDTERRSPGRSKNILDATMKFGDQKLCSCSTVRRSAAVTPACCRRRRKSRFSV
jgi:hypothetical protein